MLFLKFHRVADRQRTTDEECAGYRCAYIRGRPGPFILAEGCPPTRLGVVRTPFIFRPSRLSSVYICIHIYLWLPWLIYICCIYTRMACVHICVYLWNPKVSNKILPDSVNFMLQDRSKVTYLSSVFLLQGIDRFFSGLWLSNTLRRLLFHMEIFQAVSSIRVSLSKVFHVMKMHNLVLSSIFYLAF